MDNQHRKEAQQTIDWLRDENKRLNAQVEQHKRVVQRQTRLIASLQTDLDKVREHLDANEPDNG